MRIKTCEAPLQWSKIRKADRWCRYIITFKKVNGMIVAYYNKNYSAN